MRGRAGSLLVVAFLVLLVNAPLVRSLWTDVRLARDGVTEQVAVTGRVENADGFFLSLDLEPERAVAVDETTYRDAVASGRADVRRLPGTATVRVEGQVRSPVAYVVVGALDVVLVAAALLLWRVRPRLRPDLVLRATADLIAVPAGAVLDREGPRDAQRYVVAGVVSGVVAGVGGTGGDPSDEVVLDLGDRRVRVLLDGHVCPVPDGATARAEGVMIG